MRIAALAATLSDWTRPVPGMATMSSQADVVPFGNPASSFPRTSANGLLPLAKIGSSLLAQRLDTGLFSDLKSSWTGMFALAVAAQTLVAYWTHRWMHATPLLWRVHRVHHSDPFVDVSTSLRHHPLELLVTTPAAYGATIC